MNVIVNIKKADGQVLRRVCCPFLEEVTLEEVGGTGHRASFMCESADYCYGVGACPFIPESLE